MSTSNTSSLPCIMTNRFAVHADISRSSQLIDYRFTSITFPDFPSDLTQQIVRIGEHPIAGGAFADVWRCTYVHTFGSKSVGYIQTLARHSGSLIFVQVAVKALRLFARHRQLPLEIRRQLEIWRRFDHPNVLPFLGITAGFSPFVSLVSQWMSHGTLQEFIVRNDATMTAAFRLQLVRVFTSRCSLSDLINTTVAF